MFIEFSIKEMQDFLRKKGFTIVEEDVDVLNSNINGGWGTMKALCVKQPMTGQAIPFDWRTALDGNSQVRDIFCYQFKMALLFLMNESDEIFVK